MEWKRAVRDETALSNRRTWASRCGHYKVQESVGKFSGMLTVYYALFDGTILSRHQKREPAEKACQKHVRTANRS